MALLDQYRAEGGRRSVVAGWVTGMPTVSSDTIDLDILRDAARGALGPIRPAERGTPLGTNRTAAGKGLPPYYLVRFLLVDFLGFPDLGRSEKIAWSVPIEYCGRGFLIEHRKFGLGVFAVDAVHDNPAAEEIARRIANAVRIAEPFFRQLAATAIRDSHLNVVNRSGQLFKRFEYLRALYLEASAIADACVGAQVVEHGKSELGAWTRISFPVYELRQKADWLAIAAIEAFFSWTEHVLIHVAVLLARAISGPALAELVDQDWSEKFKAAIDLT